MITRLCIYILFLLAGISASANYISGSISDNQGSPLPYANVYVKNSSYGVAANLKGHYFIQLKPGKYTLVFSYVGYMTSEREIELGSGNPLTLNVTLEKSPVQLEDFSVIAVEKDKANQIMEQVRGRRKYHLEKVEGYSCRTYVKTSIEKELTRPKAKDTLISRSPEDTIAPDVQAHLKKEKLNLIESVSLDHFQRPSSYKELVQAHHDYVEKKQNLEEGVEVSVGISYGYKDIAPVQIRSANPYIIYQGISDCDFNFYENLISFSALCEKPLLSPIAATSGLSYRFTISETFEEDGILLYKIRVKPILKAEALFDGYIFIEDSTWALHSVDLKVNSAALFFCSEFRIIQNYQEAAKDTWVPVRREMTYTIRDGRHDILGNTRVDHSQYEINPDFDPKFFGNEVKRYESDAFDKDSSFWLSERPILLESHELEFVRRTDSIQAYYASDEYYRKVDSMYNHINWYWFWATGVGHRNRAKGNEFYISGVFEQVNFFGIGGYRHKLPGHFNKDFKNGYKLETRGFIDYGFKNKDIKGKVGVGLTYMPLRFMRTFIDVGDYYDRINPYSSIEQVYSRSNYVRNKTFSIAQRMEVINGLFAELTFGYWDQNPLTNIQLSKWSEWLFGELNDPSEFVRYTKAELKLEMKYRIGQRYIIRKNRKIILGTDYPEINLIYQKGIPDLMGSEVNYDYIEIGANHELQAGRWGTSRWRVLAGAFYNKKNLRVLEYKYFRGSDRYFFSDPLRSFQLLGPTLSTPNTFLRANYIHHFDGTLMNKIPLNRYLKLSVAAGAGTLIIPADDFRHAEFFAGLERNVRIKQQLLRFGVYAVTSDNNLSSASYTLKFGIDFFNTFTNRWSY